MKTCEECLYWDSFDGCCISTKSGHWFDENDNLRTRKATVEDALRFLLGYLQKPEEAAAAFGLEEAADVPAQNVVNHGHNPSENPRNSLEKEAADVGINPAQNLADGKEDKSE